MSQEQTDLSRRDFIKRAAAVAAATVGLAGGVAIGNELSGNSKPNPNTTPSTMPRKVDGEYFIPDPNIDVVNLEAKADPQLFTAVHHNFATFLDERIKKGLPTGFDKAVADDKESVSLLMTNAQTPNGLPDQITVSLSKSHGNQTATADIELTPRGIGFFLSGDNGLKIAQTNGEVLAVHDVLSAISMGMDGVEGSSASLAMALNAFRTIEHLPIVNLS